MIDWIFYAIVAACAALVGYFVVRVYWDDIVAWFRSRTALKQQDASRIAFTLQEKLQSGNYRTVQGIFSPSTNEIVDGRAMESPAVDSNLAAAHAGEELVIYS